MTYSTMTMDEKEMVQVDAEYIKSDFIRTLCKVIRL